MDISQSATVPTATDLSALRSKIRALRHHRALLTHTLLTSPRLAAHLSKSGPSSPHLNAALSHAADHARRTSTALHRATAGLTAFRLANPDPNAPDRGRVLGIRIEVFSRAGRRFGAPVFLFLVRRHGEAGAAGLGLGLERHTLPECVDVRGLESRFLAGETGQVGGFVRAVRRRLLSGGRSGEAWERVRQVGGVGSVRVRDASGREADVEFEEGIVARVLVGGDGRIETVAVGRGDAAVEEGEDLVGREKMREIQRVVRGGDGKVEGLAERLQRRSGS